MGRMDCEGGVGPLRDAKKRKCEFIVQKVKVFVICSGNLSLTESFVVSIAKIFIL